MLAPKRRNVGKYIGKQQWIEYLKQPFLRQPFMSFSFCKVDESVKVLKLLCGEWKEVIFQRNIIQTTSSLVLWLYYNNNNDNNDGFIQHFHNLALHLQNTCASKYMCFKIHLLQNTSASKYIRFKIHLLQNISAKKIQRSYFFQKRNTSEVHLLTNKIKNIGEVKKVYLFSNVK